LTEGRQQERQGRCTKIGRVAAHRHAASGLPRRTWTANAARTGAQLPNHQPRSEPGDESHFRRFRPPARPGTLELLHRIFLPRPRNTRNENLPPSRSLRPPLEDHHTSLLRMQTSDTHDHDRPFAHRRWLLIARSETNRTIALGKLLCQAEKLK